MSTRNTRLLFKITTKSWHQDANKNLGEDLSGKNPWQAGDTQPEKPGCYERGFTDGAYCNYWNGRQWMSCKDKTVPHWRQVGDYPVWRIKPDICTNDTSEGVLLEEAQAA